jgi:hypothetical protein
MRLNKAWVLKKHSTALALEQQYNLEYGSITLCGITEMRSQAKRLAKRQKQAKRLENKLEAQRKREQKRQAKLEWEQQKRVG